jgi:quinol-cytochrome oxidoreductase complex cytochrome b subunit
VGINAPDNVQFTPYYTVKDIFGAVVFWLFFSVFLYYYPNLLGHTDNYIKANPMVTPTHIVPEWYFLPFYAILRSVPDKLGGVVLLLASILVLLALPFYASSKVRSSAFRSINKVFFWLFFSTCLLLGWIGGKNIEPPFYFIGQAATFFYFFYLLAIIPGIVYLENIFWKKK